MIASSTAAGGNDLRIDKKEQAKCLKIIQDYIETGDFNKAIKYCNISKMIYF
jgi:hypothetical protein